MDCGAPDAREQCCADHDPFTCELAECRNGPCPHPGVRWFDPYHGNFREPCPMAHDSAGCTMAGTGGYHSKAYAEGDGPCAWCGAKR